ncbi:unnamed protein product [Microthlaspi erraticum]|uniref:BRCT domain-containing protein n=1 Tax=Microthlaspi erraticum TaxID=1685480 RepID=A0A6D2K1D3_9BRAS|nr:unnamed protein product [Microthlaspi erraticum]
MVNYIDTEVFDSDSKSPPAPSDHSESQDTEPIDEEIELDSSLLETPFQNLYEDTELVVYGNDEETLDQELGGVEGVVDDSEDDENGGNGSVAAAESAVLRERSPKAKARLLESDGSNDHECQRGSLPMTGGGHSPGMDFVDSQEPGESTQANALGFVDQFLMDKDLDLSPVGHRETSWRMKSPPFSGAKGRQSLAKSIKTISPTKKMRVFDWDGDVSDSQNSPVTPSADFTCFKRGEDHVTDDDPGVKKGSLDPCESRKVLTHPTQSLMQMEQTLGLSEMDAQLQDKASKEQSEPEEEEFIDIGISTQIAAEAMSSLLYAPFTKVESRESEMRDQVSNLSRRNNDTIEGRNKKRNSTRKFNTKEATCTNVSAITSLLNLCEWSHPRAKRSRLTQRHHVSPRKYWGARLVKDRSETNTWSNTLRKSLSGTRQASSCQSGVSNLDPSPRKICGRSKKSSCNNNLSKPFLKKEITRLGGSGKVGDIVWKDLRRRRNLAHVRVLFSHNLDDETIKQQKKIMVRLGISPASSSADSTHFIAERFSRTRNVLEAIALGKPVVTPLWLESCGQTRCLIDEKNYILRDSKKEKDGFCMLTSLARAKQHPLLKGFKVCITPNIKPDRSMIADLVKLTQGQVVEISEILAAEDREIPDDLLILSCEDDKDFCLPLINQGAEVYTSEFLLNGIVLQKLEYDRNCLF